jgi:hypothetical protein
VFGLEDLFVVGLGFDIAGAWLVARGLIASPSELALRTASLWNGNPVTTASQIKDRMSGQLGLASLVLGFSLQGVGYAVLVGSSGDLSRGNVGGVVIAALVPVALVFALDHVTYRRRLTRAIIEVARYDINERRTRELPGVQTLLNLALAFPDIYPDRGDQDGDEYLREQMGVESTRVDV